MYLSKVRLNWAQAKNPYEQHRALWHLFPHHPQEKRDFLYRVEQHVERQGAEVIMQSIRQPQHSDFLELLAVRTLNLSLQPSQRIRFRLRANPVKTIKGEKNGTRSIRVPLIQEEQLQAWLSRKLTGSATIEELVIQKELPLHFRKQKEQRNGKIQTVLFEGILAVVDPKSLMTLMQTGIGPAKSFGCGMLSVAAT